MSAANTAIFVIEGTPAVNRIYASNDATGRLVLSSPDGIVEPDGAAPECTQDTPTQVSCIPGYIGAIAGDLGSGKDVFEAAATLATPIGLSLVSDERPLAGGAGKDRIVGGIAGDLLTGGSGNDTVLGLGGGDLIRGEAGRDYLAGGGAPDVILGGSGPDRLDGGRAKDFCHGGGGVDTAKACNVTRRIP